METSMPSFKELLANAFPSDRIDFKLACAN
jgi:hypothetical protein